LIVWLELDFARIRDWVEREKGRG